MTLLSPEGRSLPERVGTLPATGFVRLPTVLHHIPVSKTSWWRGIQSGDYPKPVKLSAHVTAWRAEDIHALIKKLGRRDAA